MLILNSISGGQSNPVFKNKARQHAFTMILSNVNSLLKNNPDDFPHKELRSEFNKIFDLKNTHTTFSSLFSSNPHHHQTKAVSQLLSVVGGHLVKSTNIDYKASGLKFIKKQLLIFEDARPDIQDTVNLIQNDVNTEKLRIKNMLKNLSEANQSFEESKLNRLEERLKKLNSDD